MQNYIVHNPNTKYVESNLSSNIMVGDDGSYYFKTIRMAKQAGLKYGTKMYNTHGYPIMSEICIMIDGKTTVINVGRLVLEAFGQPKPFEDARVIHLNNDVFDNHLSNLKWGNHEDVIAARNQLQLLLARQKTAQERGFDTWSDFLQDSRYKHMKKLGFDTWSDYIKYIKAKDKKQTTE